MITDQIVKYPERLWKVAKHIGDARTILSKNIYAKGTDKYRGKLEEKISAQGVIGELIAQWYCNKKYPDKNIKFASLVDIQPQPEPDVVIDNNITMDIKTVDINSKYVNINVSSHTNPDKQVDWYWCINLISKNQCTFKLYKHNDVYLWEQKIGFNEYYSREI